MMVDSVRMKCIRVNGLDNQSHIIKVSDIMDPLVIRQKITQKFNIKTAHDLFVVNPNDPDSCKLISFSVVVG